MSVKENKEIVRRYYEEYRNKRKRDLLDELVSREFKQHGTFDE